MKSGDVVFRSKEMELAIRTAQMVAPASSPVLIEGESGTGKELIARLVHSASPRRHKPFVAVNCGAIPETLFESELFGHIAGSFTGAFRDKPGIFEVANGGVLFLDEIGDLSLPIQAKLLRVLQESEFRRLGDTRTSRIDVRVISATNKDLENEMKHRRFREDLFFRISVLRVYVEPLRRRREDVPVLADHFAAKYAALLGKEKPEIAEEVLHLFDAYAWPGNVRELENEIQRLIALSPDGTLAAHQVSKRIKDSLWRDLDRRVVGGLKERLAVFEREIIKETLEKYQWNKSETARHLGLTRQGLHRKVHRLGILREH
ncbi:MAG: sigma-54 dependent transcriptional regulator [Candidatus Eisenbacteria bacterium]